MSDADADATMHTDASQGEGAPEVAATDAAPAAGSLADLDDGVDETLQEQQPQAEEGDAGADAGADGGAVAMDADGDGGDDDGEGGGGGAVDGASLIASADPALVEQVRAECRLFLQDSDPSQMSFKNIMSRLKEVMGKKVVRKNKALIKEVARQAATERDAEFQAQLAASSGGAGGDAEGEGEAEGDDAGAGAGDEEEEESARAPLGDAEEDEDEEAEAEAEERRKKRRRLRKARGSDDEDDEYTEKRSSKKSKKSDDAKKRKKSSSSSAAAASEAGQLSIPPPKSSWLLFMAAERPRMREEHPDAHASELQKLIAEKWAALDADEKGEYEALARRQKEEYRTALRELKESDPDAFAAHLRATGKSEEELLRTGGSSSSSSSGASKKKKSRSADDEYDDGDDAAGDRGDDGTPAPPKEESYFDSIVRDLKSRRATKSELSPEEQKAMAQAFVQRMERCAAADEKAAADGKPALQRLAMLPDVVAQASKPRVAEQLLDCGLLRALNAWLAREPDGSLPNVRLRTAVYAILTQLGSAVNEANLGNSRGLGKRLMRLWNDADETASNKRTLASLMERWMQPMLGLSTSFRALRDVDEERAREILHRKTVMEQSKQNTNWNPKRTRAPEPARFDYAFRPQHSREDADEEAAEAREVGGKRGAGGGGSGKGGDGDSRKDGLRKKMANMKKGGANAKPRFKVDITGRASNL